MRTPPGSARTPEVVDALAQLTFRIHDLLARASAAHDLSVTQLRLLGILRDRSPAMSAIAEHLGIDRSSVTGLVDRAERRGLVARSVSPEDARVTIVRATPRGLDLAGQLAATVSSDLDGLLTRVPRTQRTALVGIARSILAADREGHATQPAR